MKHSSERCTPESKETPAQESRSHPVSFLRKAERLAERAERAEKRKSGKPSKRYSGKRG